MYNKKILNRKGSINIELINISIRLIIRDVMKKVVLIDGNNLVYRSFYATAYSGTIMRNSKGFPTNALYGFATMINKIMAEEKPEYVVVAFDIGKNFRKEKYDFYKEGRHATPDELKMQMPVARKLLTALGIKYCELAPYEADDIIGTIAKKAEEDAEYYSLIVSSDKDLLQLISFETDIKLLKQNGFIRYNEESFKAEYGIEPKRIVDLKALMGDSSDNIPGVKGIGEKGALKLLQEYHSLEEIYQNIDNIKGKTKEKLEQDKENAFLSYELATIYREVPIDVNFEEFLYKGINYQELKALYEELEFKTLLKNLENSQPENEQSLQSDLFTTSVMENDAPTNTVSKNNTSTNTTVSKNDVIPEIEVTPNITIDEPINNYIYLNSINDLVIDGDEVAFYLGMSDLNYHIGQIIGLAISTKTKNYFVKRGLVEAALKKLSGKKLYTYDLKKTLVSTNLQVDNTFDIMLASYLINMEADMDISKLMNHLGTEIISFEDFKKSFYCNAEENLTKKSRFIYQYREFFQEKLKTEHQLDIYNNIELPVTYVLADIEKVGFKFQKEKLEEMKLEVVAKLNSLTQEIHDLSGCVFNISSPKQLGEVLFDKMQIGTSKKKTRGYKTDIKTLQKYVDKHPIINKILEYRNISKLLSTYLEPLDTYVLQDGKIHTIFNQTLTRTGRLSSSEPNLQNIPVKLEYGRNIRKAFVPSNDLLLSADYSQIELRILAHISKSEELINAFKNNEDIHTLVASDIYGVSKKEVTKQMRSTAKAVIFGIVYGISSF
ncbi:MAG: DNA polymerase I, partial [Firmicutes bacterium]|nr:DNA polymerase I [Bacillota bacterium]